MENISTSRPAAVRRHSAKRLAVVLAVPLALVLSQPAQASPRSDREYEQAVQSFRSGRTSEAYGQFVDLANRGDPDAARIALFLHGYGQPLLGKQWDAFPSDVRYWSELVRNSGNSARPVDVGHTTVLNPRGKTAPAQVRARPAAVRNVSAKAQ